LPVKIQHLFHLYTLKLLSLADIYSGIGGTLHVFQPSPKGGYQLEKIINVFDGQKVHGIISSQFHDLLIIYGGQQFGILDTSDFKR
jgi:hypothetical protein